MKQNTERWFCARAWYTAGRMQDYSCPRCGANGKNMADVCSADLADPCPGFQKTDELYQEFDLTWRDFVLETVND